MTRDDHVDELAALYSLGALEPDEIARVEAHLAGCARCRRLVAEARELGDLLALAAPVQAPPRRVREALLRRVQAEEPAGRRSPIGLWRPFIVGLSLTAAACLLIVALAVQGELNTERGRLQALAPSATQEAAAMATLVAPQATLVPLQATGAYPAANGRVMVDNLRGRGVVTVRQLPAPPAGMAYQVWLSRGDGRWTAGTFNVDGQGLATVEVLLPGQADPMRWLWVTIEPIEGSAEPTGEMVLAASL